MINTPSKVIEIARSYVGTKFYPDGRVKGSAVDCIGLIVCICKELGWDGPDCCEFRLLSSDTALQDAIKKFNLQSLQWPVPGSMLCLQFGSTHRPQNHFAILTDKNTIIHATDHVGLRKVVEHSFGQMWLDRLHSVWALPTVSY